MAKEQTETQAATISRSQAEQAGWQFVHSDPGGIEITSETQNESRIIPASYRAEKSVNGTLVQAEAENMELLLQRIAAIEELRSSLPATGPATLDVTGLPLSEQDEPLKTVVTPEGDFTEQEWSQIARRDTIVTEEGQQHFAGETFEGSAEHRNALDQAYQAIDGLSAGAENMRARDLWADQKTKQVVFETANRLDSPGIGAGGTLVVPVAEQGHSDTRARIDAQAQEAENTRVLSAQLLQDAEVAQLEHALATKPGLGPTERAMAAEQAEAVQQASGEEPSATKAAADLAKKRGVDLAEIEGTGEGGRITVADVEDHLG